MTANNESIGVANIRDYNEQLSAIHSTITLRCNSCNSRIQKMLSQLQLGGIGETYTGQGHIGESDHVRHNILRKIKDANVSAIHKHCEVCVVGRLEVHLEQGPDRIF
jgi:hypothetical protein